MVENQRLGQNEANNAAWIGYNRFALASLGEEQETCPQSHFFNQALMDCLTRDTPHYSRLSCDNVVPNEPAWG